MTDFFPDTTLQAIIKNTGGVLAIYRGQEAYFHFDEPSYEVTMQIFGQVVGFAKILVGSATVFRDLEENDLITVDGDDYLVADWKTPLDGGVMYIALKTGTRT